MRVKATAKFVRTPSRKLQLVAGLVRGRPVAEASGILAASPQAAAGTLAAVLDSAVANASNNHNLKKAKLAVESVLIGPGPTQKRFRARARGLAASIRKRSSHITVVVAEAATPAKSVAAAKPKPAAKPKEAK